MAMIACPGCGLPRAEDQIATKPCPLCNGGAAVLSPLAKGNSVARPSTSNSLVDVPADVSELNNRYSEKRTRVSSAIPIIILAFLLGTGVGIGGVLGWQSAYSPDEQTHPSPLEREVSNPISTQQFAARVETAPMPHLPPSDSAGAVSTEAVSQPKKAPPPLQFGRTMVIHLNQPEATYTVPFPMKKGEHVVVRGKVKALRLNGLDAGAILDASDLDVASVFVSGKVDGRSNLKLNAPNGAVTIAAYVTGNSRIEVNAAGGHVRFAPPTTSGLSSSQIDGGASVTLTASTVDLRGDVDGTQTRVVATVAPGGFFKTGAVRGTATVEYAFGPGTGNAPEVSFGTIAPTATVKKRN